MTVMDPDGAPTPVAWTRMRAPQSLMAPTPEEILRPGVGASPMMAKYGPPIDRESARERLARALEQGAQAAEAERQAAEAERQAREAAEAEGGRGARRRAIACSGEPGPPAQARTRRRRGRAELQRLPRVHPNGRPRDRPQHLRHRPPASLRVPDRIVVTGSAGRLGRAVVADLLAAGYTVVAVDRIEVPPAAGLTTCGWDGRDVDRLAEAIDGCSALIHLAAIPAPYGHPHQVVFGNNVIATFAALQAAADAKITRAVIASSGSVYGTAFSPFPSHPRYVPVDEDHPLDNADPYGLSKEVDERTAEMFTRRYQMSVAALRFHWITERDEQLTSGGGAAARYGRPHVALVRGLWGYVDLRDAARACRLAVEAAARQSYGFAPMNIVADDMLADVPLAELISEHVPDIEIRGDVDARGGGRDHARRDRLAPSTPGAIQRSARRSRSALLYLQIELRLRTRATSNVAYLKEGWTGIFTAPLSDPFSRPP